MPDPRKQSIDIIGFGYKIKAGGMLDFEELYQELQRWFTYMGYTWQETKYRVIENPDGSKQVELKWVCPKEVDDYVNFEIRMDLQVFHSDIEANVDGVKKKLQNGGFEFRLGAKYEKNWKEFWIPHKKILNEKDEDMAVGFKRFKKDIYERVLIKDRIEAYEAQLYTEAHMLFDEIKAYMKLYGAQ
jgi:hypothetical protein